MLYPRNQLIFTVLLALCLSSIVCLNIKNANIHITVTQEHHEPIQYDVKLGNKNLQEIKLTQSSKVKIQTKLQFTPTQQTLLPELITYRLRHSQYENLTEPVLARYNQEHESFIGQLDLGDPKLIQPFTSEYQLQLIIADQLLEKNIRESIATSHVTFRKSLETFEPSQLHYRVENVIETSKPQERIDPPALFTIFVVLVILAVDGIFLFGLRHLKVNVSLIPKSSVGFLLNCGFLVVLMANLAALLKFWINWTFLETLQCLLILLIPTALIANYALVHVRKC